MRPAEPQRRPSLRLRLQILLLVLIAWDIFGLIAEITFGSSLLRVSGSDVEGLLGGRISLSGALLVPLAIYGYALVDGPLRHRGAFWVGAIEQAATAVFGFYHLAGGDLPIKGAIFPIVVSLALLTLVLMNMPREQPTT